MKKSEEKLESKPKTTEKEAKVKEAEVKEAKAEPKAESTKKSTSKKKTAIIATVLVAVVLAVAAGLVFAFRDTLFGSALEVTDEVTEEVAEGPSEWEQAVDKTVAKIEAEAKKIKEAVICSDEVKENCLAKEAQEERLKKLEEFKTQAQELTEGATEDLAKIEADLADYLKTAAENDKKAEVERKKAEEEQANAANNQNTATTRPAQNTGNGGNTGAAASSQFVKDVNSVALSPIITRYKFVDDEVAKIINRVTNGGMSNYEKLVAVYNYVIQNMHYDASNNIFNLTEAYAKFDEQNYDFWFTGSDLETVYWAERALIDKSGVCDTYASLLQVLTRRLGFEVYTVAGYNTQGGGHAWNVIVAGGNRYILDAQGDDNGATSRNYYFGVNMNDVKTRYNGVANYWQFNYFREVAE